MAARRVVGAVQSDAVVTRSAGVLLYRHGRHGRLEVLLVHPGGPFWAKRDGGAWSIPKGEYAPDEDPWTAACREFSEELGHRVPESVPLPLGEIRQKAGKYVMAWAVAGDLDPQSLVSNTFEIEWPPRSGRRCEFPEVDRAEWFDVETARTKLVEAQIVLLERLSDALGNEG